MAETLTKEIIVRRLAYPKYLIGLAKRQIEEPETLGFAGLLLAQDAIEMVLLLGAEHYKFKAPHELMKYWEEFRKADPPVELESQTSVERVHKARNGLKHQGVIPPKAVLNEYVIIAQGFLTDSVKKLFQIDFDTISLCDLIEYRPSRKHLKIAQENLSISPEKALGDIAVAFEVYIKHFYNKHSSYGKHAFGQRPRLYESHATFDGDKRWKAPKVLQEAINEIFDELDILRLGIDYIDYTKYKLCVPKIWAMAGGEYHIDAWRTDVPTSDSAKFAHDFVIEQILRLQQRSFERKYTHGHLTLAAHEEKDESKLYDREDRIITIDKDDVLADEEQ